MRSVRRRRNQSNDPITEATIRALKQIIDSLLELMFDAGVTVREFNYLLRERAVHTAAKRVSKQSGRPSKSRIAIMTGLARSEVGRISRTLEPYTRSKSDRHPARRVLAAWFDNPRFLTVDGEPAVLPIFGKRRSFEGLVKIHGGGIPVRAMLDELTQINAVERLPEQRLKARSRVPISTGLTPDAITAVGERCGDLLQTLTNNLRRVAPPLFEATSLIADAHPTMIPIIRREIAEQGESFINGAGSLLKRSLRNPSKASSSVASKRRVGVTVYYFEDRPEHPSKPLTEDGKARRTNLRRRKPPLNRAKRQAPQRWPSDHE
jgi:Family of unknown function (DUF6502)